MTAQAGRNAKRQDTEERLGPKGEHAVPRKRDAPITTYIDNGRGLLIIGEHPDSAYIAVSVNGASTGMFLDTEEKIIDAISALWAIKRRRFGKRG